MQLIWFLKTMSSGRGQSPIGLGNSLLMGDTVCLREKLSVEYCGKIQGR